jgi:integrase
VTSRPRSSSPVHDFEAASLRWDDVDLARAHSTVGRSKTEAGVRVVHVVAVLQDELTAHRTTAERTAVSVLR